MDETIPTLSNQSRITISFAISIMVLAFWVGVAWASILDLKQKVSTLESIDRRLSHIEGKLGVASDGL